MGTRIISWHTSDLFKTGYIANLFNSLFEICSHCFPQGGQSVATIALPQPPKTFSPLNLSFNFALSTHWKLHWACHIFKKHKLVAELSKTYHYALWVGLRAVASRGIAGFLTNTSHPAKT